MPKCGEMIALIAVSVCGAACLAKPFYNWCVSLPRLRYSRIQHLGISGVSCTVRSILPNSSQVLALMLCSDRFRLLLLHPPYV
jgi:hypothetical protein